MHPKTGRDHARLATLAAVLFFFLGGLAVVPCSTAQTLVVPKFSSRGKGAKRLASRAWKVIAQELKKQGAKMVSSKTYYRKAKRMRIRRSRSLKSRSVKRLAKALNLDAVLIGSVRRKGRRYRMNFTLRGADGSILMRKAYRLRKRRMPRNKATELAILIMDKVTPAEAPPVEPPPIVAETPPAAATPDNDTPPAKSLSDEFLPAWARDKNKPADKKTEASTKATSESSTEAKAPAKSSPRKQGSVNDALLAVGASFHHRAGLNPRHEASLFPGLRVDGRMFLGTFLDMPGIRDIGFGGFFDMGMGLEYGYQNAEENWSASQMQWRGELLYRLAFDVTTSPAILFKVGYGGTSCSIDSDAVDVLDASYMAPYAGLDIYLTLWPPMIRFFASGSFLFLVSPGGDLDGSGMGFSVMAGIDVDLIDLVHVGLGYDMTQYMIDAEGGGSYSDTYQGFFIRAGVNFN
ncbi:MAG: hypothetical protein JRF33_13410 [Deltaproteobacteria bacterium]|nr:hypothetical protein [Deltaproteobacteria bacterium]